MKIVQILITSTAFK